MIDKSNANYYQASLPYIRDSGLYYATVRSLGYGVLFDSGRNNKPGQKPNELKSSSKRDSNRFDIICAGPSLIVEAQGLAACQFVPGRRQQAKPDLEADPISLTRNAIAEYTSQGSAPQPWPFAAGAIALFGYGYGELRHDIHRTHYSKLLPTASWPDYFAGIYQWAIIQDHKHHKTILLADKKLSLDRFKAIFARAEKAATLSNKKTSCSSSAFYLASSWQSSLSQKSYNDAFDKIQDYISSGDCYQVNLTLQHSAKYHGDPWQAYTHVRQSVTTPFSVFMENPHGQLLSFSPERFIRSKHKQVVTQPIKGTRPRGKDPTDDARLMADLSGSSKDRAENLMIVDLLRNDLGKCCVPGSVSVPKLFQLESYSNVHHLVSTITGELRQDCDSLELLQECMPGGSITGAPKRRAMEIIAELEPHQRSIYCGSMAYISADGNMDSNILIRSLLFANGTVFCWGGGGLVADSTADAEYQESLDKVNHLLQDLANIKPTMTSSSTPT